MPDIIRHKRIMNGDLLMLVMLLPVFVIPFALVNILKFRMFSSTCFGWVYPHIYPKLASFQNPFSFFVLPEYNILIILAPLNYFLAFFYYLIPRPEGLFVLQAIIMSIGSLPVYLLAKRILKSRVLSFSFFLSYLLHPAVATGAMLGFMPLSFGAPFIIFALYFLEKEDFPKFIAAISLAILSKIDVALMLAIFGATLLFQKKKTRYAKIMFGSGVVWFIAAVLLTFSYLLLIQRRFPVGLPHLDKYGSSIIDAALYAVHNPLLILHNIFNPEHMLILVFFSLPCIFCFFAPRYLLVILPEVLFVLIRNQHSTGIFLIISFVFVGSIYGLERILKNNLFRHRRIPAILGFIIIIFALARYYNFDSGSSFIKRIGPLPFSRNFNTRYYSADNHARVGKKVLEYIPGGASCLTLQSLAIHLGRCKYLAPFSSYVVAGGYPWDYVAVDLKKEDFYGITPEEYSSQLRQFLTAGNYGVFIFEDGWLLLKKGYATNRNREALSSIDRI